MVVVEEEQPSRGRSQSVLEERGQSRDPPPSSPTPARGGDGTRGGPCGGRRAQAPGEGAKVLAASPRDREDTPRRGQMSLGERPMSIRDPQRGRGQKKHPT